MYFIANWKMFGDLSCLNSLNKVIKFLKNFKNSKNTKVIYCPPNTLINIMANKLGKYKIGIGAQNCHENENFGAFTGSVNSKMLKNVGARYVILGHSENRQAGENDNLINKKIKSALKTGLKVIFCIGETYQERRKKKTKQVLSKQIKIGLKNIKVKNNNDILIAYEPVWAIGTGLIPKNKDLHDMIEFIRKKNRKFKILYGGSVNPRNIYSLNLIKNINGYLIGGASQDPKKFIDIIKKTFN